MTPVDTAAAGLDRVVLGDNQFFAVNHMSQERSFAQAERFSTDEAILDVMRMARDRGVGGMMLHSHPRAEALCDAMRADPGAWGDFRLYPCIPYAFKYVMALNEKGFVPVLQDQIKKAGVGKSLGMALTGGLGLASGDTGKLVKVLVDLELQIFRDLPVGAVFLHNVVTDLLLSLGVEGMLRLVADHLRDRGFRPAFGTLNLPLAVERLRAEGVEGAVIMTPVNPSGFFMNPSREACEEVLGDGSLDVMAMSILASGGLPAEDAFAYAASFPAVKSFLFGASRRTTLEHSLGILADLEAAKA
jgi:hypothetical protein